MKFIKCLAPTTVHVPNVGGMECVPGCVYDADHVLGHVNGQPVRLGDQVREDCFEAVPDPADTSYEEN